MTQGQYVHDRPTIKVLVSSKSAQGHALEQVLYGIEEEGIPNDLSVFQGDAKALSWEASQQSRLEVGLGLDGANVVLQYGKMLKGQPLFEISSRSPDKDLRAIGANAARLVKKLPFKQLL